MFTDNRFYSIRFSCPNCKNEIQPDRMTDFDSTRCPICKYSWHPDDDWKASSMVIPFTGKRQYEAYWKSLLGNIAK